MAQLNKEQKEGAKAYFEQHPEADSVFVNPLGHCFTKESYALSSVEDKEEIKTVKQKDVKESGGSKSNGSKKSSS